MVKAHLRQAQEIAEIGSWHLDIQAESLYWSEKCYRIFGVSEGQEMTYERFLDRVHPEDREFVTDRWQAALDGDTYDIEHRIVVDGEIRWVRERAEIEYGPGGEPVTGVGIVRDITEQKRREREREAARKRYQTLLQGAPDPIFVAEVETGKIVEVNAAAESFLGMDAGEILGMHQSELHPAEDRETYRRLFDRSAETGGSWCELPDGSQIEAVTAEGERIPVEITVNTVALDEGTVIYGIFRDISDQIEREQELRGFRQAVEAAGHSIYFTDEEGTIEYVNPAFEETTGYSKPEAVGRNPRILKSGKHPPAYYERLWETITAGSVWQQEVVNETKDGETYVVDQTIAPIEDEDGTIDRFVAVNSDITDIRRREEMLEAERDRAQSLRQRLSVLNRILRHDVRSTVNVIKGNAELVESTPETDTEHIETIQQQADELLDIAENARLIEETIATPESQCTDQDLREVVDSSVVELAGRYPDASFERDLPESLPVTAHEQLEAAVEHILRNAVQHSESDHPKVHIHGEVLEDRGDVHLTVEDDGPGIPQSELEALGNDIEKALHHSSGLGLWIVYWLIQRSGGEVEFEDREPTGTRVRISLPT